jgi:hypothetical protein
VFDAYLDGGLGPISRAPRRLARRTIERRVLALLRRHGRRPPARRRA